MGAQRIVIARRWTGLGDCIVSLLAAARFARATRRGLVVDWRHSAYSPGQNLFPKLFEPSDGLFGVPFLGDDRFAQLRLSGPFWPPLWTSELLEIPPYFGERGDTAEAVARIRSGADVDAPVVVFDGCLADALPPATECAALLRELRPRPWISLPKDTFVAAHFTGRPVVGIHVRHGNGGNIMDHAAYWVSPRQALQCVLDAARRCVFELRDKRATEPVVFLCTDSIKVQEALQGSISNLLIRPKGFRAPGTGDLHLWKGAPNGLLDAAIEMMLLAEVDVLIRFPPASFFSFWGATLKRASPIAATPAAELGPMIC